MKFTLIFKIWVSNVRLGPTNSYIVFGFTKNLRLADFVLSDTYLGAQFNE